LLPIVAAPEPHGEASVNLTESAESTSPVSQSSPSSVNLTGSTSEAPVNLTGSAESTSPMSLTGSAGEAPVNLTGAAPVNLTGEPSVNLTGEAPVNLTGEPSVNLTGPTSEPRESKAKQRKRRPRRAHRSASPVARKTVEDRARELDELIRSGELTETSSVNRVRLALRCSPENARKAIEWRRAHLVGEVTGEAAERLTGEPIAEPIGEVTGELVDDPTSEVVDVVIDPHELTAEPALAAAR